MESRFRGVGVALVTPFKKDLTVDFDALKRLIDHTSKSGVDYLVVCGTTGESATLSSSEKKAVLEFVIENNPSLLPILYGIGGNNTVSIINTIRETNLQGVSSLLSVSPFYNKPSQSGIVNHYSRIADHSPLPIILYNVPGRTSSNLSWETTITLSTHDNIIGIKEASGDLEQCMRIEANTSSDFLLISGDDLLTLPIMSIGGVGVISVLANAFGGHFKSAIEESKKGNYRMGAESIFNLLKINPLMYVESNPVGIKEVLKQLGICENYVRMPLETASEGLQAKISAVLREVENNF